MMETPEILEFEYFAISVIKPKILRSSYAEKIVL